MTKKSPKAARRQNPNMQNLDCVIFQIGSVQEAHSAAFTIRALFERNHKVNGMLYITGFDDDPEYLDQIPEASNILKAIGDALAFRFLVRLDPVMVAMIFVAQGKAFRIEDNIMIPEELSDEVVAELKRWKLL